MALYDGFFDAVLDEETWKYDREYNSGYFTGYFGNIIGSGVCVYENPDSFRVRYEDGAAVIAPGYLFIQGYWLRNTEDYAVDLTDSGVYAVLAHLNMGQRTIEILTQEKAEDGVYPDSLVLAYVTIGYGGLSAVEDTRENTDVCGVVDAIGSLSGKVQYALSYIDNEVEKKLEDAEKRIQAQSARLDLKIAEVAALVEEMEPPPVGTVKFSASQNVGPEWLRCDGSFISQADYPELVEALGKLIPGAEDFQEVYGGTVGAGMSNGYLYNGTLWAFSVSAKKLYGYNGTTKALTTVNVTGADSLTASAANPVYLSIVGGHLFLAQNQTSANAFVLLECESFTGSGTAAMTELDIKPAIQKYGTSMGSVPGEDFIPEIVSIRYNWGTSSSPNVQDTFAMALGRRSAKISSNYLWHVFALIWKKDDFSTATIISGFSSDYRSAYADPYLNYINTLFRYSHKNASELLALDATQGANGVLISFYSTPNGTYDTVASAGVAGATFTDPIRTSPVAGNGRYIYRAFITGGKLNLRAGKYNPNEPYNPASVTVADPVLPSRANVFPDSVCYAANQDLWFVFVGTGIAFSQTPEVGNSWGYLDTQDVLGVITQFGSLEYDPDRNLLYICGQDTLNVGKLGVMKLPELYNYANDGAWLPMIASNGIPAYIKAVGDGGGGDTPTDKLKVTVLEPVYYQYQSLGSVAIILNGTVVGVGTSNRTVNMDSGTFTVGLRILSPITISTNLRASLYVDGSPMATISLKAAAGTESTVTLNIADYLTSGVTLQWKETS